MTSRYWPIELRATGQGRRLAIDFGEARFDLTAEYLRVQSPSAEVQGHAPSERKTVGGMREVAIARIEPVGHYAVKLVFSDGHDTGLYTWDYLHALGTEHEARWNAYLADLTKKGLSRDRPGQA